MADYAVPVGAAALAAACAGPIFLVAVAISPMILAPAEPRPMELLLAGAVVAPALVMLSCAFGFVLAILPCLIGSLILTGFAEAVPVLTSWLVWIGAGFALPGVLPDLGFGQILDPRGPALPLMLTGAACAAICRRGLRAATTVDAPLPEPRPAA